VPSQNFVMEPNFCDRGHREALEAALVRPEPLPYPAAVDVRRHNRKLGFTRHQRGLHHLVYHDMVAI